MTTLVTTTRALLIGLFGLGGGPAPDPDRTDPPLADEASTVAKTPEPVDPGVTGDAEDAGRDDVPPGTSLAPRAPRSLPPRLATPPSSVRDLDDAFDLARATSPVLGRADADVDSARGRRREALGVMLPTLTATGTLNQAGLTTRLQPFVGEEVIAGMTFPDVERGGLYPAIPTSVAGGGNVGVTVLAADRWASYSSVRAQAKASALDRDNVVRQTTLFLALGMIDAARQQQAAMASRNALDSVEDVADLTHRRMRMGAAIWLDVVRAEQEVQLAKQQIVLTDETTRRARESLGILLGRAGQWGVDTTYVMNGLAVDVESRCNPVGAQRRADTKAADMRVTESKRALTSSRLAWVPRINASGQYLYTNADPQFSPNRRRDSLTIAGSLSWQLFDGGVWYGRKRQAEARVRRSEWDAQDVRRRAVLEAVQADRGVIVATKQLDLAEEALALALRTVELSQRAFERGDASSLDMQDALRRLRLARLDQAIRRYDRVEAEVRATVAQGQCRL